MSIQITEADLQTAKTGTPVHFHDLDTDFVVVRADLFDRIEAVFDDGMIRDSMVLVNEIMAPDDADDPLLHQYQQYRKNPA